MSVGDVAEEGRDAIEEHGGTGALTEPDDRLWDLVGDEGSTGTEARETLDDLGDEDDQEQLHGFEESGDERDGTREHGTVFDDYEYER